MDTTEGLQKNILDATLRVFDQKGLKFTMDDLAKELSISKKTIYTVYDDKEALFLAMVDYIFDCMPLCKGALCSAAILVFIDYWNMVEQPLILLSDAEMHPLSVFLSKINSGEIGLAFAVATIYMVPSLLVFLYGEEYLVDGITYQGGVKG